jgi:hypothetical protein
LPARSPHFVASSSASFVSSDLNWSHLAPSSRSPEGRRRVTGYLRATHEGALSFCSLADLKRSAVLNNKRQK